MTYTIIAVKIFDKGKDGQLYRSKKNGDPFKIATVTFAEDSRQCRLFLWGNATCEVGYQYEGTIKEEMYNEKMTYTFVGEQKVDKKSEEIAQLEFSLANAHQKIDEVVKYLKEKPWLKDLTPKKLGDEGYYPPPSQEPNFDRKPLGLSNAEKAFNEI